MDRFATHALAFVVSIAVGGVMQQLAMILILGSFEPAGALIPLAAAMLGVSTAYGAVLRLARTPSIVNKTAAWLVALVLVVSAPVFVVGYASTSPGVGGNIVMAIAVLFFVGFSLPMMAAILIHWWLRRRSLVMAS